MFLYDHGDDSHFSNLNFLDLYLGLMNINHSSLQIYNESCQCNSMISTIKNYFAISEAIRSFKPKITQTQLFFLASVANNLYPEGNYLHWNNISTLDNKYYIYTSKKDKCDSFTIISSSHNFAEVHEKMFRDDFISNFSKDEINSLIRIVKCYKSKFSILT